jgi:TctA family transporter
MGRYLYVNLLGMIMKNYKFSRPAFLMSFILFPRIESSLIQLQGLHFYNGVYITNSIWYEHPILTVCIVLSVSLILYGLLKKDRSMDYA